MTEFVEDWRSVDGPTVVYNFMRGAHDQFVTLYLDYGRLAVGHRHKAVRLHWPLDSLSDQLAFVEAYDAELLVELVNLLTIERARIGLV